MRDRECWMMSSHLYTVLYSEGMGFADKLKTQLTLKTNYFAKHECGGEYDTDRESQMDHCR